MTSSMYAAVSGLKTHMSALGVIGNNVANVNTYAYKATRYTFDEALYTNMRSGSNGTDEIGGNNPAQIGFGCTLGTIDLDMSTKIFNTTGRGLDCMIDGDGFFVVGAIDHAQVLDAHQGFAFGDAGVERIGAVGAKPLLAPFFTFNLDFGFRHPCPSFWKRGGKRIRLRRW